MTSYAAVSVSPTPSYWSAGKTLYFECLEEVILAAQEA